MTDPCQRNSAREPGQPYSPCSVKICRDTNGSIFTAANDYKVDWERSFLDSVQLQNLGQRKYGKCAAMELTVLAIAVTV